MRRNQTKSGRRGENGIVILLVAVVLLFVVGAMAALSIDVVTFYTARSEAQLAADGAALAGARVLANSGMTSDPNALSDGFVANAETLALTIAKQVATQNQVGGRTLNPGTEVTVTFNDTDPAFNTNPRVTVQTQRTDIPTFFARIWGRAQVRVQASATAEAYNPSGVSPLGGTVTPVAPVCVKPWLLPNISPNNSALQIFDTTTGTIGDSGLLGWNNLGGALPLLRARCQFSCGSQPPPGPAFVWRYYVAAEDAANFPPPSASSVRCTGSAGFTPYQLSVAGCVQRPIACNSTVTIDFSVYSTRNAETRDAVNCMAHTNASQGDSVDPASVPPQPFQFLAGADNPVVQAGAVAGGTDVMVSDSLVTVPVFDSSLPWPPTGPVTVIGFAQLFLNPDGNATPGNGRVATTIVNLAGCGTGATGQPILGNGASPVPVRLVTAP